MIDVDCNVGASPLSIASGSSDCRASHGCMGHGTWPSVIRFSCACPKKGKAMKVKKMKARKKKGQ
jgi:hypothetical protein